MKKMILLVLVLILLTSFILALELPPEPMAFYGKVTYTNGTKIPNGYYIAAKIGTAVSGECEIISGEYGRGSNTCIILNPLKSTKIEFYLGQYKLGEYNFKSKEIVNLDFITSSLPTSFTPLSNGICELSKGECSYNVLDCDASSTNACAGNGICDTLIGETCTFTSQDCGVCLSCGDAVCNNIETCSSCAVDCGACPTPPSSGGGGGGGGGSGGSSSSSSSSKTNTTNLTTPSSSTGNNPSELNIQKLDENNEKSGLGLGITGAVVGFAKSTEGIVTLTGLMTLVVFAIAITSIKRKKAVKKKVE